MYTVCMLDLDSCLGKVGYSTFSDQMLMEMLFEGFDQKTKKREQVENGYYRDVCEWWCVKCDDEGNVVGIYAHNSHIRGSLDLGYVPPKVKFLSFLWNRITGSIDLSLLQDDVEQVYLFHNNLSGSINLIKLPSQMRELSLTGNKFSGEIDLTHLPASMKSLELSHNKFSGEISFGDLPESMTILDISNNAFTGSFIVVNLPSSLKVISAGSNNFATTATVFSKLKANIYLKWSGVKYIIDENGNEIVHPTVNLTLW